MYSTLMLLYDFLKNYLKQVAFSAMNNGWILELDSIFPAFGFFKPWF